MAPRAGTSAGPGRGEAPAGARRPDALRPPLNIQAHPATEPGTPRAVFLGASLSRSRSPRLGRPFGVACGRLRRIPGRRSPGSLRLRGRAGKVNGLSVLQVEGQYSLGWRDILDV